MPRYAIYTLIFMVLVTTIVLTLDVHVVNRLKSEQNTYMACLAAMVTAKTATAGPDSLLVHNAEPNQTVIEPKNKVKLTSNQIEHQKILDANAGRHQYICTWTMVTALLYIMIALVNSILSGDIPLLRSCIKAWMAVGFPFLVFCSFHFGRCYENFKCHTSYDALRIGKYTSDYYEVFSVEYPKISRNNSYDSQSSSNQGQHKHHQSVRPTIIETIQTYFKTIANLLILLVFRFLAALIYIFVPTVGQDSITNNRFNVDVDPGINIYITNQEAQMPPTTDAQKICTYGLKIKVFPLVKPDEQNLSKKLTSFEGQAITIPEAKDSGAGNTTIPALSY